MKRYGQIIRIKPESESYYRKLHANVWPGVLDMIRQCNIRNYSIFIRDGLLFSYFEYVGDDYEGDMKKMADDPETQRWWKECMPCQQPIDSSRPGEWWADMEEVFYTE